MEIKLHETSGHTVAELRSDSIEIRTEQDALEILANCAYQGAYGIIVSDKHLAPEFFDLKTGVAGAVLQKFSNYKVRLAIIGDFSKYESNSLKDFIYESNKTKRINFVSSFEEAKEKLV